MRRYAQRLGATHIATGHYARVDTAGGVPQLHKGVDPAKDQSYFLHAVAAADLVDVLMPLGGLLKSEVRELARAAGLAIAEKKDSTGICFIGERPFAEFLRQYLPDDPGVIRDDSGVERGRHRGLAYYTLGQRHGLNIGGAADRPEDAWYVAAKDTARNELIVVQGHEHPLLKSSSLVATGVHWIGPPPREWERRQPLRCQAKIRYRQPDQACTVIRTGGKLVRSAVRRAAALADAGPVHRALRRRPLLGRRDDRSRGGFAGAARGGLGSPPRAVSRL